MTREIEIGRSTDGRPVMMDVDLMLRNGLLVQANSGGGKSWLLRRLAEQLCAVVPTFVVDVEGEFASLREKFPFVLVAKSGGDAAADPRIAAQLARQLLELRVSAVFDLFELDLPERHQWMRAFLDSMDKAPRDLWGDTAILIDEAHVFAPERGKGESVALGGMSALASRGRKRGFGPVDATQRIGKFHKDVAAELKNAAIGLAWLDIDRDRAIDTLGVGRKEREDFDRQLRHMRPGEFFVIGRAFGTIEPVKVKIGAVESTHPEPGQAKQSAAPPPPAKIRAILAKLGDLPKEAPAPEGEAGAGAARELVAGLRRKIADLEARDTSPKLIPVFPAKMLDGLVAAVERAKSARAELGQAIDGLEVLVKDGRAHSENHGVAVNGAANGRPIRPMPPAASSAIQGAPSSDAGGGDGSMRMLRALAARHPTPLKEQQVAVLSNMSRGGGTFRTYRGKLTGAGLLVKEGDYLRLTDAGVKAAGQVHRPNAGAEMLAFWRGCFQGKAKDLLELLAANGSAIIGKDDALARLGLDPAGGTARTYWGQLSGCGLIERAPGGFRAVESLRL